MKNNRLMARLIIVVAMSICLGMLSQSLAFAAAPCHADIAKYCAGTHGAKLQMACLKEHKVDLSRKCKLHVEKAEKTAKNVR